MKNVKLIIDGKEIEVQINEEDFKKITTTNKITGYERVRSGSYYYDTGYGSVDIGTDIECVQTNLNYDGANYYSNINIANNNVRADKLMRRLRRFAVKNRKEDIDWTNENQNKYYLYYDYVNKEFFINSTSYWRTFGQIYFDTKETAQQALEIFKDELLWYFTEYCDSL